MAETAVANLNPSVSPGLVRVKGRIASKSRKYDGVTYTLIVIPAHDEYSSPSRVEVRSKRPLGALDEDVDLILRVGGFNRRPVDFVNKDTGETERRAPNVITLDVVE